MARIPSTEATMAGVTILTIHSLEPKTLLNQDCGLLSMMTTSPIPEQGQRQDHCYQVPEKYHKESMEMKPTSMTLVCC